jgi:hypothetical protein
MTVVIEDEEVVRKVEALAALRGTTVNALVTDVVREKIKLEPPVEQLKLSREEFHAVVREAKGWFAANRDPNDHRTPEEIIGYNEHGLFD